MTCRMNQKLLLGIGLLLMLSAGCAPSSSGPGEKKAVIRIEGSDTMVNLAQAWAEAYSKLHPEVSVQVSGGGSGVGIASLVEGVVDMANASRDMEEAEIRGAEANTGKTPKEFAVALDALAVYVHRSNPAESITIEELAEIYGDKGNITKWAQLGIRNAGCVSDEITRVGRQNSSGTYAYFREVVLGKARDYQLGSIDQSGSKDVVALVGRTPCAIGYSGMGYNTHEVKWLKVSRKKGETGVEPSVASARDGSYPLARPLYIYTLGEPTGAAREYIDWILSDEGQEIVVDLGYVPQQAPAKDVDSSTSEKAPDAGSRGETEAQPAAETPPKE